MNPEPKGFVQTPNNARLSDLLPNSAQATLTLTGCSAYKVMGSWCLLSQRQITAFHIHSLPLDSPRQERVQPLSHQRPAPPRILNIPLQITLSPTEQEDNGSNLLLTGKATGDSSPMSTAFCRLPPSPEQPHPVRHGLVWPRLEAPLPCAGDNASRVAGPSPQPS